MGLAEGYKAWLITVGNEVLIGRIVNTNMAWLGRKLTLLGYKVVRGLIVPDDLEEISWAFREALKSGVKVVVSTGGLGPTFDDKTAEGLALALDSKPVLNREALKMIEKKYKDKGLELTKHRIKMAIIPKDAKPIKNPVGTAPGIYVKIGDTHIFALPGVPSEMKAMFEESVEPFLKKIGPKIVFVEKFLKVKGLPESEVAPVIDEAMKLGNIYVKSHPKGAELGLPIIDLHITASGEDLKRAEDEVNKALDYLREKLAAKGGEIIEHKKH